MTGIWISWNHFDKEYCFKFVKAMLERIQMVIKVWGGATLYKFHNIFLYLVWEKILIKE